MVVLKALAWAYERMKLPLSKMGKLWKEQGWGRKSEKLSLGVLSLRWLLNIQVGTHMGHWAHFRGGVWDGDKYVGSQQHMDNI